MEFNSGQFQFPQNDTRNEIKFSHRRCFSPDSSPLPPTPQSTAGAEEEASPSSTNNSSSSWVMGHTQLLLVCLSWGEEGEQAEEERTMPIFILHSLRRGGLLMVVVGTRQ